MPPRSQMSESLDKSFGHEQYKAWLKAVGGCFSPLSPCKEPLRCGTWTSWTVEGLYQGLKLFAIEDLSLIASVPEVQVFASDPECLIHVTSIMSVGRNMTLHPMFRLLKNSRRYEAKKNQCFGRLPGGRRNWRWTETWRHPTLDVAVGRQQFIDEVFIPSVRAALSQHRNDVLRLRSFWAQGQHLVTNEMRIAHGHLAYVEEYVSAALVK